MDLWCEHCSSQCEFYGRCLLCKFLWASDKRVTARLFSPPILAL